MGFHLSICVRLLENGVFGNYDLPSNSNLPQTGAAFRELSGKPVLRPTGFNCIRKP
jgi:hypothetical protein